MKRDDSYGILHAAFIEKCVNEREMNCFSLANLYHFGGVKMSEIEIILSLLTENKTYVSDVFLEDSVLVDLLQGNNAESKVTK